MRRALKLAWLCAVDPDAAAARSATPEAFVDAVKIWLAFVVASMLFTVLKPAGFPEPEMAAAPSHPPLFWLRVVFWQPVLAAVLVGFIAVSLRWLGKGWLALKLATGVALSIAPFIVSYAYHKGGLTGAQASLLLGGWVGLMAWYGRAIPLEAWRRVAVVVLGLNGISLASLVVELGLIPTGSVSAYKGLMIVVLLWVLGAAARIFKRTEQLSTPRALAAVFFALLAQNVFVFTAYLLGWLPLEVLKVLMYA